jgi:hypothetical protein
LKDQGKQNQLSENIKQLAMPEATKIIADEIVKLIKKVKKSVDSSRSNKKKKKTKYRTSISSESVALV